jgi:hypothetical protein
MVQEVWLKTKAVPVLSLWLSYFGVILIEIHFNKYPAISYIIYDLIFIKKTLYCTNCLKNPSLFSALAKDKKNCGLVKSSLAGSAPNAQVQNASPGWRWIEDRERAPATQTHEHSAHIMQPQYHCAKQKQLIFPWQRKPK